MENGNGKTPTANELHRRLERTDSAVHENSRRIMALETNQVRMETKLDSLIETVNRNNTHSENKLGEIENFLAEITKNTNSDRYKENGQRDQFNQMWGAAKIIGFALMLIATSSTAVVMLL
ncbi:MAG: hypothetical protein ABEI13_01775 [Candidatus Paceibacteria bacterium]